ncbi:MAG: hypothetical protein GY870_12555 [archaeon]|nr:hypothetical protein [archaeon]
MNLNLSKKNKKIVAGVGITGGIVLAYFLLRNRFGFNEPNIDNWKRSNRSGQIRTTRASIQQLQNKHKRQTIQSQIAAETKRHDEEQIRNRESSRRHEIYRANRAAIEKAKRS